MLIISRKQHETITIIATPGASGPAAPDDQDVVEIELVEIKRNRVRLAIKAPSKFLIWRGGRQQKAGPNEEAQESAPADPSV